MSTGGCSLLLPRPCVPGADSRGIPGFRIPGHHPLSFMGSCPCHWGSYPAESGLEHLETRAGG